MQVIENLSVGLHTPERTKAWLISLSSEDRAVWVADMADHVIRRFGEGYEGTPEYGDVVSDVVCGIYEEFLGEDEAGHPDYAFKEEIEMNGLIVAYEMED